MTRYLPVFPLGSVLMPTQILPLHVFEPRYRVLMSTLTGLGAPAEMGVVLIERGSEVGGGDVRVGLGTVTHLIEAEELPDGRWVALFAGSHRFRVERWLPDDPYPQAEVDEVADGGWEPSWDGLLRTAEDSVRQAVALAAELGEEGIRPAFELSADPGLAAWQLCALAPLGPLDRQRLLEEDGHGERLAALVEQVDDIAKVLAFRLRGR
jgi:Lon protease-like protein